MTNPTERLKALKLLARREGLIKASRSNVILGTAKSPVCLSAHRYTNEVGVTCRIFRLYGWATVKRESFFTTLALIKTGRGLGFFCGVSFFDRGWNSD